MVCYYICGERHVHLSLPFGRRAAAGQCAAHFDLRVLQILCNKGVVGCAIYEPGQTRVVNDE
jgi:hypothetical protein